MAANYLTRVHADDSQTASHLGEHRDFPDLRSTPCTSIRSSTRTVSPAMARQKARAACGSTRYELLMKGGKDGSVIIAGDPEKSLLLQRVTLPPDHKQFMPAEGRPPLGPEEIALIRAWIHQGASPTATTLAGIATGDEHPELPLQPVGDYSGLMPEIRQMQQTQGAKLIPYPANPRMD